MQNFDTFVTNLLENPSQQTKLSINGKSKLLKGMARFRTRFSDYFPTNGNKEFLSLGWIVKTGKRADVNPKLIPNESVDLETSS